jgi:hypothetical protein
VFHLFLIAIFREHCCANHIKVKESLYRPGEDLRVPGDSRWKGCQFYAPATFIPQEIFLVLISVGG